MHRGNCFFVTLFILVLNNAAKSVCRTATRKKASQLFRRDTHKLLFAVAGELLRWEPVAKHCRCYAYRHKKMCKRILRLLTGSGRNKL